MSSVYSNINTYRTKVKTLHLYSNLNFCFSFYFLAKHFITQKCHCLPTTIWFDSVQANIAVLHALYQIRDQKKGLAISIDRKTELDIGTQSRFHALIFANSDLFSVLVNGSYIREVQFFCTMGVPCRCVWLNNTLRWL